MSTRTILVVEDNRITRKMMRVALEADGFQVLEAEDGRAAVQQLRAAGPRLVLLDILLPDTDGFALVSTLRAEASPREIAVLAVTGFVSKEDEARAFAAGFDDFLIKPIEPSRLCEIVRSYFDPDAETQTATRRKRVLVIDDDAIRLALARTIFRSVGFDVVTAAGGKEALALARGSAPDAIVTDVVMPGMDALVFCDETKREAALADVPVVVVTSHFARHEDLELAAKMGAAACVLRTPGMEYVVDALRACFSAVAAPEAGGDGSPRERYLSRIIRQLERHAAMNAGLAQRCSLQSATLAVLGAISDGLTQHVEVESALADALALCLDAVGASLGVLYLFGADGRPSLGAVVGPRDGKPKTLWGHPELLARVYETGRAVVMASVDAADEPARALLRDSGMHAAVLLPISAHDERLGALLVGSRTANVANDEWRSFVATFSSQIGQALALRRAFAKLEASEARYRTLVETAHVAVSIVGLDGVIREVNPYWERLLGRSRADVVGTHLARRMRPDVAAAQLAAFDALVASGGGDQREVQIVRPDGTIAYIDFSTSVVTLGDERVLFAIGYDVTARRDAEQRLRLDAAVAALAADVNIALTSSAPLEVCLRRCVDAAVRHLHATFAGVWTVDATGEALELVASAGTVDEHDAEIAHVTFGESWVGSVARERMPRHTNRVADAPAARDAWVRREQIVGFAGHPLVVEGRLLGVLALFSREPLPEIPLSAAASIADAVALGIRRKTIEAERTLLEAQLRQSQRMEAIGQLSGGIAHDFNNLLAVILSSGELLLHDLAPSDPRRNDVDEIIAAGHRAAALTRQLLAFSRQLVLEPRLIDLNEVVDAMNKLLRRLIGENIEVTLALAPALPLVRADPSQIEQIVMNLAVNARDAMAPMRGGKLELATTAEGDRVVLAVRDNGCGMDDATRARIFEPFFTTKGPGRGTGLGLATVYGIVKQSGGDITVRSVPGEGTTFRIALPRVEGNADARATPARAANANGGTESVLLVEDESAVRAVAARILRARGHRVIEANGGAEALARFDACNGAVDLVVTDMVMPGMSGAELLAELRARAPGLKALVLSGHIDHPLAHEGVRGAVFLQKPFTPETLAAKVRQALDAT